MTENGQTTLCSEAFRQSKAVSSLKDIDSVIKMYDDSTVDIITSSKQLDERLRDDLFEVDACYLSIRTCKDGPSFSRVKELKKVRLYNSSESETSISIFTFDYYLSYHSPNSYLEPSSRLHPKPSLRALTLSPSTCFLHFTPVALTSFSLRRSTRKR